jgi:hypothetical protein
MAFDTLSPHLSKPLSLPSHWWGRLIDFTAERPVRDIAQAHELVIDVAPDAASPVAAALTRECIFKVGVAVVLAHDFPRERGADPCEQFHRNSPKPTLTLVNDTLPFGHQGLPHTGLVALRPRNAVMSITSSDALYVVGEYVPAKVGPFKIIVNRQPHRGWVG